MQKKHLLIIYLICGALGANEISMLGMHDHCNSLQPEIVESILMYLVDDSTPLHEITYSLKQVRMVNKQMRDILDADGFTTIALPRLYQKTNNHYRACRVLPTQGALRSFISHQATPEGGQEFQKANVDQQGFMEELAGYALLSDVDERNVALDNLTQYIKKGISINYRWRMHPLPNSDDGVMLLLIVDDQQVQYLQSHGETTPLILSVNTGCLPLFDILVARPDLDVNALDETRSGKKTALMRAVCAGDHAEHMVKALLERADIQINKIGVEQQIYPCNIRAYDICYDGAILKLLKKKGAQSIGFLTRFFDNLSNIRA